MIHNPLSCSLFLIFVHGGVLVGGGGVNISGSMPLEDIFEPFVMGL